MARSMKSSVSGTFHLEQMDSGHWWIGFGEGPLLHVHLHARGKIVANVIDDRDAPPPTPKGCS